MRLQNFAGKGRGRVAAALAVAVGLAMTSCSAGYVEDNDAPVLLLVTSINSGSVLDSDIRIGATSSLICEDEVPVALRIQSKNPSMPLNDISTVLLKSYEVRYFRTDGRGVEGVDVPYRITGSLAASIDAATSVPIEVVRRQAKLEPPLTSINQALVLTVMAEVTIHGETVGGRRVSGSGRFQIDFADFGDDRTECPAN